MSQYKRRNKIQKKERLAKEAEEAKVQAEHQAKLEEEKKKLEEQMKQAEQENLTRQKKVRKTPWFPLLNMFDIKAYVHEFHNGDPEELKAVPMMCTYYDPDKLVPCWVQWTQDAAGHYELRVFNPALLPMDPGVVTEHLATITKHMGLHSHISLRVPVAEVDAFWRTPEHCHIAGDAASRYEAEDFCEVVWTARKKEHPAELDRQICDKVLRAFGAGMPGVPFDSGSPSGMFAAYEAKYGKAVTSFAVVVKCPEELAEKEFYTVEGVGGDWEETS